MLAVRETVVSPEAVCRAVFIVVSGYEPQRAMAVVIAGQVVGTVTHSVDAVRLQTRTLGLPRLSAGGRYAVPRRPELGFCSACNRPSEVDPDFPVYCLECAPAIKAECLAREHRLPGAGEFWCTAGHHIRPTALQSPPDPTHGRIRRTCQPCRSRQKWAAEHRRRASG